MDFILKNKLGRIMAYTVLTLGVGGFLYMIFINLILVWDARVAARPNADHRTLEELAARHHQTRFGDAHTFKYLALGGVVGLLVCCGLIWYLDWKVGTIKHAQDDDWNP